MDDDSLPTRQSLLSRLRDLNDSDSWQTFFDRYWRLIYNVARKSGLSDDQAQEVVQETVIVVARKIPEFQYDPEKGSFKQWLLLITRRRIHDQLRRLYRLQNVERKLQDNGLIESETAPQATPPDAAIDAVWEEEWREAVIQAALARVRQRVNPKQYQVFHYCVLQELPVRQVAGMLGLNAAQVYLAKHRTNQAIKREAAQVRAELEQTNGMVETFRPR